MNQNTQLYPMVDAAEALALTEFTTIGDFDLVESIAKEYARQTPRPTKTTPGEIKWYSLCLYKTLFHAGRLQGIREERARRRGEHITR